MKRLTLFGFLLLASPVWAAVPVDRTVDAAGANVLEIENAFGSITVNGGRGNEVHVGGSIADFADRIDVRRDGSRIIVHVVYPERRGPQFVGGDASILEISAPEGLTTVVNTVSANISIAAMQGEQRLNSVSGNIETSVYSEDVRANTVSGDIRIDGRDEDGRLDVASVSGRVRVESVGGEVRAQNVSGSVSVTGAALQRGELQTVSGNVSLDATLAADGRIRAQTTSGNVDIELNRSPAGRFELSSFSGRIDSCFGPSPSRPQFGPPTSSLRFDEDDASIQVYANTMSGNIDLCRSE